MVSLGQDKGTRGMATEARVGRSGLKGIGNTDKTENLSTRLRIFIRIAERIRHSQSSRDKDYTKHQRRSHVVLDKAYGSMGHRGVGSRQHQGSLGRELKQIRVEFGNRGS